MFSKFLPKSLTTPGRFEGGFHKMLSEFYRDYKSQLVGYRGLVAGIYDNIEDFIQTKMNRRVLDAREAHYDYRHVADPELSNVSKALRDKALADARNLAGQRRDIEVKHWDDEVDLNKVDWMSMRNSLEVRVPLLDHHVVELAFRIAGTLKLRRGKTKYLLKETFKDLLPSSLYRRPKAGFEIPISRWLKTDLRFLLEQYFGYL